MKLFYIIVQVLLKVSILLFYLRVFPVPWIQILTWILIVFTLLHGVGFFFPILFQCKPVALLWNPRLEGHCIQLETIIFPGAIFSIVEDLAILLLPIPCLSKLNVGKGKKISLISMFSVGIMYETLQIFLSTLLTITVPASLASSASSLSFTTVIPLINLVSQRYSLGPATGRSSRLIVAIYRGHNTPSCLVRGRTYRGHDLRVSSINQADSQPPRPSVLWFQFRRGLCGWQSLTRVTKCRPRLDQQRTKRKSTHLARQSIDL